MDFVNVTDALYIAQFFQDLQFKTCLVIFRKYPVTRRTSFANPTSTEV